MADPLNLLRYWRASLADGQLFALPDTNQRETNWADISNGKIATETARALLKDWKGSTKEKSGEVSSIPVLIAPLVFIARHSHGTPGKSGSAPYAPLILPAQMAEDGRLFFDPGKHLPWIARIALEPSAADLPSVGNLDDFDAFRSSNLPPEDADWAKLIGYTEKLCRDVTGAELADLRLEGYERGPAVILAAFQSSSPAKHLIALSDSLKATAEEEQGRLPPVFASLCQNGAMRPPLAGAAFWAASARHLGQMGADYPLADRQRDAVRHLLACGEGDVLPVNGPPGTGKTTLLQSIVATMMVEAAIAGGEPPVIVVSSTNNQAVTNVIDSFGRIQSPSHSRDDPLQGRWLPGVSSFALYLPSAAQKVPEGRYHLARLPDYGDPLSGFPIDMLSEREQKRDAFLAKAETAFGEGIDSLAAARQALELRLVEVAGQVKAYIGSISGLLARRSARPGQSVEDFAMAIAEEEAGAEALLEAEAQVAANARDAADRLRAEWRAADTAVQRGLREWHPTGGALATLLNLLLGLLPNVRAERWRRCRGIIGQAGITDGPFESLAPPRNIDGVNLHLDRCLSTLRQAAQDPQREAERIEAERGENAQRIRVRLSDLKAEAAAWKEAEASWQSLADALLQAAAGIGSVADISQADLLSRPECAEALLDVTLRHDLFLLAVHYWEARWLERALALPKEPAKAVSGKFRRPTEERWRLMACLTPCFVSTLFMLPNHLRFYDPDGKNKNPPLTDFVDLLIVDEAGQVPAEIGALGMALGRKVLVVGDIHQIEPVWSIGLQIDEGNISSYSLRNESEWLDNAGARARDGSLMRLARNASAFAGQEASDPGIFLTEHRRCQPPIVAVCNELVYANRLVPRTPVLRDPILPPLGWANVRAPSTKRGGSRCNPGEAEAIAEWLKRRCNEIEQHYGKPLGQLVGIVTPFSAQKGIIRQALGRHGIEDDLTVGTVHALQGAEREIVLFSPVHTAEDGGRPFFDGKPMMINVAVSRAKHSFLVFGDMRLFDPSGASRRVPSGVLARHMFMDPSFEILDVLSRPEFLAATAGAQTSRLDSLAAHRETLREAFEGAIKRVLIVSPYLSSNALTQDGIETLIAAARKRGVAVTVAFDPDQNREGNRLRSFCADARTILSRAGADILERPRTHNKTLAVDDAWIVEGSFNWLSAARDPNRPWARQECSLRYQGNEAGSFIKDAWREVRG